MRLSRLTAAAVFVATAALTAPAAQAVAAPMPWETSKVPTAAAHPVSLSTAGTITIQCVGGCYQ
ncbi:hypothetical protein ACVNF4_30690 [Streptomyces sp. S6]